MFLILLLSLFFRLAIGYIYRNITDLLILIYLEGERTMAHTYKIALSFATENQDLVEKVYHYLKAEGLSVFFAPVPECQTILSGKNQREIFYEIFGIKAEYVALFVSRDYLKRTVPMEEASIAIAKHSENASVIPIYLDNSELPKDLFDPQKSNYYKSNNPAQIASHLAAKIKSSSAKGTMNIKNNHAQKQVFIQKMDGNISL